MILATGVVFAGQESCEPKKRIFDDNQEDDVKSTVKKKAKTLENMVYNIFEIVRQEESEDNTTTYYNAFNQTLTYQENLFGHWVWSLEWN